MMLPRSGNFYFTLLVLIFFCLLIVAAFSYERDAALVPLIIAIPSALLALIELIRDLSPSLSRLLTIRYPQREIASSSTKQKTKTGEISAILVMSGYVALVMLVGFHLAVPIFVAFYSLVFGRAPLWNVILLTAGTWGFVYLVFCVAMDLKLPWGILF